MYLTSLTLAIFPLETTFSMHVLEMNPYKVRVVFSKPPHAARVRIDQPSGNHSPFTAKPRCTAPCGCLHPPPCPTVSGDTEPAHNCAETIFSAQYVV